MEKNNFAIILAAGKGSRMKTVENKCMVRLLGKPMISYVKECLEPSLFNQVICVVSPTETEIQTVLPKEVRYVIQPQPLGTANAVLQCLSLLEEKQGYTLILPGDVPLISIDQIQNIVEEHLKNNNDLTIATAFCDHPQGYGRIQRDSCGNILRIIEEKEASKEERNIREINTGLFCVSNQKLVELLPLVKNENHTQEYYLTDLVDLLAMRKARIGHCVCPLENMVGINDLTALSQAEEYLRTRTIRKWMDSGVYFENPHTTVIGPDVELAIGTKIRSNTTILGTTKIGRNVLIGPNTEIEDSVIEDEGVIRHSVIEHSLVGFGCQIGPFAHLRPGTILKGENHIGNFVEIKNSTIGSKTKAGHLTYIGDTHCGAEVNFGCGAITVNYDGTKKHQTHIGDHVFIGCNSNVIAPIEIGDFGFIAAGSTVTENTDPYDFVISRPRPTVKKDYAGKYQNNENN